MNLFKKNDRKDYTGFKKNINPQQDNQVNSHKANHANSKPEGGDTIEKNVENAPTSEQVVQGTKQ